jgi:uncharacterized protein (DUF1697 family)
MSRFIAFLRAINAGPGRVVKMDVLRQVFESLGFVGGCDVHRERERQTLGHDVAVFIRTDAELKEIAGVELAPSQEARHLAVFHYAVREGSRRAVYDPQR